MTRREEIISKISELVVVPSCSHRAAAMLGDPDVDFDDLARVVEFDPGLTANFLKVVNASFFSAGEPTLTVKEAIDKLGSAQYLQFVISTGVAPTFVKKIEGYDLSPQMHLQHSVTVGMVARELGEVLGVDAPEYTFTAGLLSGIGKALLGGYVEVDTPAILKLALEQGLSFDQAEDEVIGINHAEVGGIVLENWRLPEELVRVARHHLRPEEYDGVDVVLDLVHMANVVAKMIGFGLGADGLNYVPSHVVAERLGLTPEHLDTTMANVVEDLTEIHDLFIECTEYPC